MSGSRERAVARSRPAGPQVDGSAGFGLALRVPAFAAVTTALGVAGHVLAGGQVPSVGVLCLILAVITALWRPFTRGETSPAVLWAGVAVTQVGIHLALMPGHEVHDLAMADAGAASIPAVPSVWMWPAHALACVLVAGWLQQGESVAWQAFRRILPALPGPVAAPQGWAPARTPRGDAPGWVATLRLLGVLGDRRRGPPLPA
jgi:hypothetical protein